MTSCQYREPKVELMVNIIHNRFILSEYGDSFIEPIILIIPDEGELSGNFGKITNKT